jgi:hypothetical protein
MRSKFLLLMKELLHFLKAQSPVSSAAIEADDYITKSRGRNYQIMLRSCKTGTGVLRHVEHKVTNRVLRILLTLLKVWIKKRKVIPVDHSGRGVRHELSSHAWTLGSWARIPLNAWMSVLLLFCICVVLCAGRGLATGWSPVQGFLPAVYRIKKLTKWPRSNKRTVEP